MAHALACCAADHAADRCACRHAQWAGCCTDHRANRRAAACTDALRQVMVAQFVGCFWIDHFACATAGCTACQAADDSACCHADRTANSTNQCARCCTRTPAHALGQMVLGQVVIRFWIHHFCCALAGDAASDAADNRACCHADRTSNGADGRAQCRAACHAQASAQHVRTTLFGPRFVDVRCIFIRTCIHAQQDAAALDAFFIVLCAFFRDAGADQRADQATGDTARTGTGQRRCQRTGHDQAQAWQHQRGAYCCDTGQHGADGAADTGANARAFSRLGAQFGVRVGEVGLTGGVGHHQVDVIAVVAALGHGAIRTLGAGTVREQASDHALVIRGAGGIEAAHDESFAGWFRQPATDELLLPRTFTIGPVFA